MIRRAVVLTAFAVLAVLAAFSGRASATTQQYAVKYLSVTVVVTPSPAPVVLFSPGRAVRGAGTQVRGLARSVVRAGGPTMIAQAVTGQKNLKVQVTTKADPYGAYFKIVPSAVELDVPYGTTTFTCPFKIFAYFAYKWQVTDWVYGSVANGGGLFPTFSYPATSDLSWFVEGVSSAYTPYTNSGSPGQAVFSGAAKVTANDCIDLKITVPNSQAAGSYSATIQYNLMVTT